MSDTKLKVGDWYWVQDYVCYICSEECAVGFLTKEAVLPTVECDNCGYDMTAVNPEGNDAS